jgi:hypothetical protein
LSPTLNSVLRTKEFSLVRHSSSCWNLQRYRIARSMGGKQTSAK